MDENKKHKEKGAILVDIMKIMNILGVLLIVFGFKYTKPVFDVLFKGKYSSDSCILAMQLFVVYIYFCGINGITEAYVYGCLTEEQMAYFKRFVSCSFL